MEEYSIAKQILHLTSVDLCEIARNSVLQSGFPESDKEHWLGCPNFYEDCSVASTNVPPLRRSFRRQQMKDELQLLEGHTTLDKMDASIADTLLLSPKKAATSIPGDLGEKRRPRLGSFRMAAVAAEDDGESPSQLSCRALLSPLPDEGMDQTDSDLLGANGEEKETLRLSPFAPLSPWPHGPPELVLAGELEKLEKLSKLILPEGSARKRRRSPNSSEDGSAPQMKRNSVKDFLLKEQCDHTQVVEEDGRVDVCEDSHATSDSSPKGTKT